MVRFTNSALTRALPWAAVPLIAIALLGKTAPPPPNQSAAIWAASPAPPQAMSTTRGRRGIGNLVIVAVGVAFFAVYSLSYPRALHGDTVFNSPRSAVGYTLTSRFVERGQFDHPLRHFDEVPHDVALALTPRDAAQIDGDVVPKDFAGTLLLHAMFMAVSPVLGLFVAAAFAVLSAWIFSRIAAELFDETAAFITFVLLLSFPPLWVNGADPFLGDTASLFFLGATSLVLLRYHRDPSIKLATLAVVTFSFAVLLRYPNVLLALPLAAPFIRWNVLHRHVVAVVAAVPAVAALLIFNSAVYGSPLTTGFHLGSELIAETVNFSGESFFKVRVDVAFGYLVTYGVGLPAVSVPVTVAVVLAAWIGWRTPGLKRRFAIATLGMAFALVGYYGFKDAWGSSTLQVNASVLRYLLPAFAMLYVWLGGLMASARKRWGAYVLLFPAVLVVAGAFTTYLSPGGIKESNEAIVRMSEMKRQVIAATPEDSVIASRLLDKALFPDRQTMTATYMLNNQSPVTKGQLETWDFVPGPVRFAEVAVTVTEAGIAFYVIPDAAFGTLDRYQTELKERGYYLRRVTLVDAAYMYKVSPLPGSAAPSAQ